MDGPRDTLNQPNPFNLHVDLTNVPDQYDAPQTYHPNGALQNRQITSQEFQRVKNNQFRNDSILNVTIQQIVAENTEYYAFSTYFMHANLINNTITLARAQHWKTTLNRIKPPPNHSRRTWFGCF